MQFMAHQQQIDFCKTVKQQLPHFFSDRFVVDIGSFDVNGNNQYLFENCLYIGVDLLPGRNVDLAAKGHELNLPDESVDVVISTECLEHDQFYELTLKNAVRMIKPGGIFIFTCATTGRPEHGTRRSTPQDSPLTQELGDWGDYYKNLEESDIRRALDVDAVFEQYAFSTNIESHDLYFWGVKKGTLFNRQDYSFQIQRSNLYRALETKEGFVNELLGSLAERDSQIHRLNQAIEDRVLQINNSLFTVIAQSENLVQVVANRDVEVARLNHVVIDRDVEVARLNHVVIERDLQVGHLNQLVVERESQIFQLTHLFRSSYSFRFGYYCLHPWKIPQKLIHKGFFFIKKSFNYDLFKNRTRLFIMEPYGLIRKLVSKIRRAVYFSLRIIKLLPYTVSYYGSLSNTFQRVQLIHMQEGWAGIQKRVSAYLFRNGSLHSLRQPMDCNQILYTIPLITNDYAPKISIIVPNFNHAAYLFDRLDSIYNQTYTNYEVILLDDHSNDDSVAILKEYAARFPLKTTCYFNQKNSGSVFQQWKKGIELATGDLIWIAESDDYCSHNFLDELVRAFANEAVMLAFGRTDFVKGKSPQKIWDSESYLSDLNLKCWKDSWIKSAHDLVNSSWAVKNIIPNVSAALFRNPDKLDLLEDSNWIKLKLCGDWVFYLTIIRGGLVAYNPNAINYYRQHSENISSYIKKKDTYYREHEVVAKTLLNLYRLNPGVLENQAVRLYQHWCRFHGGIAYKKYAELYDLSRIKEENQQRKPNILMAVFAFAAGGGETFPILLANMLKQKGYCVTLFNFRGASTQPEVRKMVLPGIPILEIDKQEEINTIFNDLGIEIVHSHHASVDINLSELLSKDCGLKQVVTMHGMYEMMTKQQLDFYLPLLLKQVDYFVYTAEKNISNLPASFLEKKRFAKINNALSVSSVRPVLRSDFNIGPDDFVLCLVSRAIPEKGWEEAITVVSSAQAISNRSIHLLIIGDGPEYDRLSLSHSTEYIHFLGFRSNIRDYLSMADMGFIPSRFKGESFPLVLIDCLHAGRPVLASNIGEIKNMLMTEVGLAGVVFDLNGWEIPISGLVKLIAQIAEDKERYKLLLQRVPAAAVKFDLENMVSQYEYVYQQLQDLEVFSQDSDKVQNIVIESSGLVVCNLDMSQGSLQNCISNEQINIEIEDIKKANLFDESFYLWMNPDLLITSDNAIQHYCEYGWREGRNPSLNFDTQFYLTMYSDISNAGINPFWHYVIAGRSEMRAAVPDSKIRYENEIQFGNLTTDIKLLSFYSTSDLIRKGNLQYASRVNLQNSLPYDDSIDLQVFEKHIHLAKRHGLYGVCFDFPIDEKSCKASKPLNLLLALATIDFRFCIQIELPPVISEFCIESILQVVSDKRYICIESRPVVLVVISGNNKQVYQKLSELKSRVAFYGLGSFYLVIRCSQSIEASVDFIHEGLCDAVLDVSDHLIPDNIGIDSLLNKNGLRILPYGLIATEGVGRMQLQKKTVRPLYNRIILGRTDDELIKESSIFYTRFNLQDYRRWLDASIINARTVHPEDRRFVFLNTWNERNQRLFLEPDQQLGFGILNETSRSLLGIPHCQNMPKVSIIVPNYNHADFLNRRLTSIYNQTYKNIEVILLDDNSSDKSRLILDQFADDYPEITRKIYNAINSGSPFHQWAKGIKAATGELIWIAESDDFCDERFLDVLVRCFDDESVLLAYSKCVFVDRDESVIQNEFQNYVSDLDFAVKWNASYTETAHNEVITALGIKNTIPNASGVLFRRPDNMPLLEDELWLSMRAVGDWIFYLHILRGGKIAYSTETTNFFRRYMGSAAQTVYGMKEFYCELGMVARAVQSLYNTPLRVIEQNQSNAKLLFDFHFKGSDEEFLCWYNRESSVNARKNRLPNVMVCTSGFYPGGAEIFPIRLANEFKQQGLSVVLLSTGFNLREDRIRKMLRNDIPLVETSDIEGMKQIIRDFGIEVLNTHQWHIQKYPLIIPDVFHEIKVHIASLHGMIEHGSAVTEEELKISNQNVTTWVYTADKNLNPFREYGLFDEGSSKFIKLPNGLPTPQIIPISRQDMNIPDEAFLLCCVSRAIVDKGWEEVILSVTRAREITGRDIRLILVGSGPVYDEYSRSCISDFVYLVGFSENSVGYYSIADMGIMLSKFKSESFPLTIIDCLFAGKPYIASDIGEIKNMLMISDNLAGEVIELKGWEVPIENAAKVIASFATDKQKYLNALAVVEDVADRYKIDIVAEQYIRLFKKEYIDLQLCSSDVIDGFKYVE